MSNVVDIKRKELSKKMADSTVKWTVIVDKLTLTLKSDVKYAVEVQADAISYRQHVTDEINIYAVKIHKLMQKMKVLHKQKFEFYSTSYQVKTNGTEKLRLIEADLSEQQLLVDELDEHVNNLRETSKHLDNISYAIKNKIELSNILGGYK